MTASAAEAPVAARIRIRAGTGRRWWDWWWRLLVWCGDGSDSKKRLPPKTVSWAHLFRLVATQHISWEVVFVE